MGYLLPTKSYWFFLQAIQSHFIFGFNNFFFGILFYCINHVGDRLLSFEEFSSPTTLFNVLRELINSVYFSGITFFTIGYSDTLGEAPKSVEPLRQILILIEAAMGIILTSTILLSFMNKYLTNK